MDETAKKTLKKSTVAAKVAAAEPEQSAAARKRRSKPTAQKSQQINQASKVTNVPSAAIQTSKKPQNSDKKFLNQLTKLVLIFGVAYFGGWTAVQTQDTNVTSLTTNAGEHVVLQESQLITAIAEDVGLSTVSINVESTTQGFFGDSFSSGSAGTGVILSSDGYIITNKHVIPDNTTGISITLSDGTTYDEIEVVGRDPFTDIAYLKVPGVDNLTPAKLGQSSEVKVGQKVVAIGNALGEFSNTVTSGIISGLSRPIVAGDGFSGGDALQNLFQTDASINPGNSGGPLVNASGEVIGINTAVAGNAENIGFSIPIDDIRSGIETVLEQGELVKPFVGVRYVSITPEIAEVLNLPVENGAYLDSSLDTGSSVVADSPADKAGLKEGDIIIKADGIDINEDSPLGATIARFKVGDTLNLTVLRDSEELSIDVVLERVPETLGS